MTTTNAARRRKLLSGLHTVFLVKTGAARVRIGYTARKSAIGLLYMIGGHWAQLVLIRELGAGSDVTVTEMAGDVLHLSNGWKIGFGGSSRQEAE